MRSVFAFLIASIAAFPAAASAQTTDTSSASVEPAKPEARLDELFAELKRAKNEHAAERISNRIWQEWFSSGSATIDLLMQWSQEAIAEEKYAVAMDFLDQVVTLEPDYAEGWNRRATLHFTLENYAKSMADIEHTLRLEPRHFGALGGMATILRNAGRKEAAMHVYERLLEIYPMMRSAQTELGALADELAGQGI